jgi:hypothetical protein
VAVATPRSTEAECVLSGSFKTSGLVNDLLAKDFDITVLQTFIDTINVGKLLVKIYIKLGSGFCPIDTTAHAVRQSRQIPTLWREG